MRAANLGFAHVAADDLFVYHKAHVHLAIKESKPGSTCRKAMSS